MLVSRQLVNIATNQLTHAGCENAQVDAWLLLSELTNLSRWQLQNLQLSDAIVAQYQEQVQRRANGTPLQHITGKAYFRHVEVAVGPGVFIPRPETELVAGHAIEICQNLNEPLIAELCAGSGAISKAILDEVPDAKIVAVEICEAAMKFLRRNIGGVVRAKLLHLDFNDLPLLFDSMGGAFDVVVTNPPYIPVESDLPIDVLADPKISLFGGDDGLDVIRQLFPVASWLLKDGGWLIIEHDETQSESIVELANQYAELTEITDHKDLTGRPRYLVCQKAPATLSPQK